MPLKRKRTQSNSQTDDVTKTVQDLKVKVNGLLLRESESSDQIRRDAVAARQNILAFQREILLKTENVTSKCLAELSSAVVAENRFIQEKTDTLRTMLQSVDCAGEPCRLEIKQDILQYAKKRIRMLEQTKCQRLSFRRNAKILQQLGELGKLRVQSTLKAKDLNLARSMNDPRHEPMHNQLAPVMDRHLDIDQDDLKGKSNASDVTTKMNSGACKGSSCSWEFERISHRVGKRLVKEIKQIQVNNFDAKRDICRDRTKFDLGKRRSTGLVGCEGSSTKDMCLASGEVNGEYAELEFITRSASLDEMSWSSREYNVNAPWLLHDKISVGSNTLKPKNMTQNSNAELTYNGFANTAFGKTDLLKRTMFREPCDNGSCNTLYRYSTSSLDTLVSSSYCQVTGTCQKRKSDVPPYSDPPLVCIFASPFTLDGNNSQFWRGLDVASYSSATSNSSSSVSENDAYGENTCTFQTTQSEAKILNTGFGSELSLTPLARFETCTHRTPCVIPDITILPDMRIVLADHYHNNIQLFSKDFELLCQHECAYPMGICTVDVDKIAVNLRRNGQVALFKANQLKLGLIRQVRVKCDYYIWNVAYKNERMFVVCDENNIHEMDLNGTEYKVIHSGIPTERGFIRYFDVSSNGERIYLAEGKGLRCINTNGETLWFFGEKSIPESERDKHGHILEDICYLDGRLLATHWTQSKILEISDSGQYVRILVKDGIEHPRAIAVMGSTLVVTQFNPSMTAKSKRTVNVFKIN